MNDEQLGRATGQWLRDIDSPPANPQTEVQQAMEEVRVTGQVRRWWPFPVFRQKAQTPTASDTAEYPASPIPASPIPATNGHTPIVIGRTQSMLSPVKAITAGALVFAIGGAFLVTQPFQHSSIVPGAEAEAIVPTLVTGTIGAASSCSGTDIVWDGDIGRSRNSECSPQRWASSDPRLTGDVVRRWNDDIYQMDEDVIWVNVGAAYLGNDDGGWTCSSTDLLKGMRTTGAGNTVEEEQVNGGTTTFDCVGNGGYQGLSALLVSEFTTGFNEEFSGLIFSGDFPPLPEPPTAE